MTGLRHSVSWLAEGGWDLLSQAILMLIVIAAAAVDFRQHRIPNLLVLPGTVLALMLAHLPGGSVVACLSGLAVGLAVTLPFYWLRAMGAGDVKLMAMVGAFIGGSNALAAALVIFTVGGVFALVSAYRQNALARVFDSLRGMSYGVLPGGPGGSAAVMPYGVSIAAGTFIYLLLTKGGLFA